jgi:hypothetical protein
MKGFNANGFVPLGCLEVVVLLGIRKHNCTVACYIKNELPGDYISQWENEIGALVPRFISYLIR